MGKIRSLLKSFNSKKSYENQIIAFIVLASILVILGFIVAFLGMQAFWPLTSENLGTFGDFLGGTTALLWALASAALIYIAFLAQRLQLVVQKEQMDEEQKGLYVQQFENTFFQLLVQHNHIVENLVFKKGAADISGRYAFNEFFASTRDRYNTIVDARRYDAGVTKDDVAAAEMAYLAAFDANSSSFGHYFRNLYTIIKFVDNSKVDSKQQYANFLRAQLSSFEQIMLFFNCINRYGAKFKPLVEKYRLLKNMPTKYIEELNGDLLHKVDSNAFAGSGPS